MNRFEHFLLGLGCGLILTSALVIADTARQFQRPVNPPTEPAFLCVVRECGK